MNPHCCFLFVDAFVQTFGPGNLYVVSFWDFSYISYYLPGESSSCCCTTLPVPPLDNSRPLTLTLSFPLILGPSHSPLPHHLSLITSYPLSSSHLFPSPIPQN